MKKILRFSKLFIPAVVFSALLMIGALRKTLPFGVFPKPFKTPVLPVGVYLLMQNGMRWY